MNLAPVYIIRRFSYYLFGFFHHWYYHGSRNIFQYFLATLGKVERTLAIKASFRYFLEPINKDDGAMGRILGVISRSFQIGIGGGVYAFLALVFLGVYLIWLTIPVGLIAYAILNFNG